MFAPSGPVARPHGIVAVPGVVAPFGASRVDRPARDALRLLGLPTRTFQC